ncbi:MAG TPA: hypothetical protein VMV14_09825 [Acidimicrobiales bacterium]|nr:hypothetical protein [Acidimicrobiales bacterium]
MTPGERCDEIMRLIDETLEDFGVAASPPPAVPEATPAAAMLRRLSRAERMQRLARTA